MGAVAFLKNIVGLDRRGPAIAPAAFDHAKAQEYEWRNNAVVYAITSRKFIPLSKRILRRAVFGIESSTSFSRETKFSTTPSSHAFVIGSALRSAPALLDFFPR
jgi:hypothetical protein